MLPGHYAADENLKSMSFVPVQRSSLRQPMLRFSDLSSERTSKLAGKLRSPQIIPGTSKTLPSQRKSFSIWQSLPIFSSEIKTQLDDWAQEGDSSEKRSIAKDRILEFVSIKNVVLRSLNFSDASNLNLSDLGLTTLPPLFFELSPFHMKLKSLDLSGNKFTTLPMQIGKLAQLQNLLLNGNRLKELPSGLENLKELRFFVLDDNRLETLPPGITLLNKLTKLSLVNNVKLQKISNLYKSLPSTCEIDLSGCPLEAASNLVLAKQQKGYKGPKINYTYRPSF
jgi:hypothetical protein